MASSVAVDKLFTRTKITTYLSGDASTATDIGWVDLRDYGGFAATAVAAALTGVGVTQFDIIGNAESDGSGTDVEIKSHPLGTAPDAANDLVVLECTAEEIRHLATTYNLRYVSVKLKTANASDNIVVTYIRHNPRWAQDGLTADVIA